jgi:proteasome assembly chaperone (PAC2) family protein
MSDFPKLNQPNLVAVWPGMGNVALNAGIYLLSKLEMELLATLETGELFDISHVEVEHGLIQPARRPRNRFFVKRDFNQRGDLVVFVGESQPPIGRFAFCRQLMEFACKLGVERVFTFAAMATEMHPLHAPRVFGAAIDEKTLAELKRLEVLPLNDGQIGGLNGVLLGAAAEKGKAGACLLGEMPHIFAPLAFPKASRAVLGRFAELMQAEIEFAELDDEVRAMEENLGQLLARVEEEPDGAAGDEREEFALPAEEARLAPPDEQRIETLFERATKNRSHAFELKRELDRLGVFKDYEDRFLDLFKKQE